MKAIEFDIKWYNVSEFLKNHSTIIPTVDEFQHYISEMKKYHAAEIKRLEDELNDFRTLKSIITKF